MSSYFSMFATAAQVQVERIKSRTDCNVSVIELREKKIFGCAAASRVPPLLLQHGRRGTSVLSIPTFSHFSGQVVLGNFSSREKLEGVWQDS